MVVTRARAGSLVLGLDTGSPLVSVAVVEGSRVLAERAIEIHRSSELLVGSIDEVLREVAATPADLCGVAALRGPGSFTGLRVGLATALALRQALGCEAAAPSTLLALAAWAAHHAPGLTACRAVVEGVRGEWACQSFRWLADGSALRARDEISKVTSAELRAEGPPLVGFGVSAFSGTGSETIEPGPLAAAAARLVATGGTAWDAADLVRPLYLAAPATSQPRGAPGR